MWLLAALPLWPQSQDADATCAHAVELHQSGDLAGAVPEYQKCLARRPEVPELRSNLGAVLAGLGRYTEAIEQYRQALRLAPGNPGLRLNLALAYYKSGELTTAAAELESLHAEQPDSSNVTLLLADCYLRSGEFKRIIDLLGPLKEQHRDDQAFAYLLGMALIRDGQVAKGQSVVDLLLRDRDSGEAHYLMATAAFMNRDFPGAVEEFQKAIQVNPGMTSIESWYGQALLETGDADGAAAAFRKELGSNPNDFASNEKLGDILSARRKLGEALPYLQRAVLVRPGSLEARFALAKLYAQTENLDEARRQWQAIIAANGDLAEAHAQLARVDEQLKLVDEARRESELAARLSRRAGSPPSPVRTDGDLLPAGSAAPGFDLPRFGASGRTSLAQMLRDKPAIVMFGSYTCPQFRSAAPALNEIYERYHERAQFMLVYVHEAHTGESWRSTVNERQGIELPPEKTLDEKGQHAALCVRKLDLKFPVVIDGMDRKVESSYGAWPSAVYLVGRNGQVLWRSRLGEQNFAPEEMGTAIAQALAAVAQKTR